MNIQTNLTKAIILPLMLMSATPALPGTSDQLNSAESKYSIADSKRYNAVYNYALSQEIGPLSVPIEPETPKKNPQVTQKIAAETNQPIQLQAAIHIPEITITPAPETPVIKAETILTSEHDPLFDKYAAEYNLDKNIMKHIAKCESGFRPEAVNGPYGGMFQFISSTWVSNRRAMGADQNPDLRFNAEEAIKTAAFKMSRDGFGAWPACSRKALAALQP